jgi:hypothetical protein
LNSRDLVVSGSDDEGEIEAANFPTILSMWNAINSTTSLESECSSHTLISLFIAAVANRP